MLGTLASLSTSPALSHNYSPRPNIHGPVKSTIQKYEATKMLERYPDRVAVFVEPTDVNQPIIDKRKFLCPLKLTMAEFTYVIRKRIGLKPDEALFLFVLSKGKTPFLPPSSALIGDLFKKDKTEENFLHIRYSLESTFGTLI